MPFSRILLSLVLITASASATPAPWYLWQSTSTGERVCAQVMAGDWQQVGGPFADSRCVTPTTPAAGPTPKFEHSIRPGKDASTP